MFCIPAEKNYARVYGFERKLAPDDLVTVNYNEHDNPVRIVYPDNRVECRAYVADSVICTFFDSYGNYTETNVN